MGPRGVPPEVLVILVGSPGGRPVIRNRKHTLAAALVATMTFAGVGMAVSSTDTIKDRQDAMETVGGAMQKLGAIAKGEAPFDAAVVKENAATMEEHLRKASTLFPEGSDTGDVETWAKAEIWTDHADFVMKLKTAEAAAEAMKSVTEESAFRPALGKLGNSCKECHQTYRRPKQR
jgi:cytochrome c556